MKTFQLTAAIHIIIATISAMLSMPSLATSTSEDQPTPIKTDPYYNETFSCEVNEVTTEAIYKLFSKHKIEGDAIIIRENAGAAEVVIIRRANPPFKDAWALPGGKFEDDSDTLENFIDREASEEVNLTNSDYSYAFDLTPKENRTGWDVRAPMGVTLYGKVFIANDNYKPEGGSDAKYAAFISLDKIIDSEEPMAFGHIEWLTETVEKMSNPQSNHYRPWMVKYAGNLDRLKALEVKSIDRYNRFAEQINCKRIHDQMPLLPKYGKHTKQ